MLGRDNVVASTDTAESVSQVGADTRARRLLRLHAVRVETRDDLVDAHHMRNGWAAMHVSGPHVALEEAWREAVRYTLKNVGLFKNLAERDAISVGLLPVGDRVAAEDDRVAVVAVRRCDGDLEGGKEGVLHVPQDVTPHGPAAAVKELLVKNDLALDNEAAEGVDLVSEHLGFCAEGKEGKESKLRGNYRLGVWNRAIYRHKELFQFFRNKKWAFASL